MAPTLVCELWLQVSQEASQDRLQLDPVIQRYVVALESLRDLLRQRCVGKLLFEFHVLGQQNVDVVRLVEEAELADGAQVGRRIELLQQLVWVRQVLPHVPVLIEPPNFDLGRPSRIEHFLYLSILK